MRYVLSPQAISRTRFVVSPLAELLGALTDARAACERTRPGVGTIGPDVDRAAFLRWEAGDPLRRNLTDLISHTKWFPDFLGLAPPARGEVRLEDELDQIAGWDGAAARSTLEDSVREAWTEQDTGWLALPDLPQRIAEHLAAAWEELIAPDWRRRQQILRREIAFRTALIGSAGWVGAIDGIARDVAWEDPDALIVSRRTQRDLSVEDHMSFVPTTQTRGRWTCDGPVGVALVYGARGSRAAVGRRPGRGLGRLLGTGRTAVLLALDLPATPTQLHEDLGYALGTIGGHLSVLDEAGLVHRARVGREVIYRRTELGESMVEAQQG